MSRPKGSRNKRYTTPENLEQDALSGQDLDVVYSEVEEKFKNFPPERDPEKEKEILATQTVRRGSTQIQDEEIKSSNDNLPFYLRNLPAGSDRSKTIVAAAQAALILGTPPAQVSAQFGIPTSRVSEWQDTLITVGAIGRRDRLNSMLMSFMEQEMKSLMAVSIVTSEEEWIMRQDAGALAQFIAVKTDRLLMLLQAFSRVAVTRQEYAQQLEVVE